ncbi:MAG: SurA N-terminal domain-containing protein [Eggerthellaceae bacterium]|nr:SurA N-terminal domain-containing protein [Eggerthellaceae bacterium]
MSEAVEELKDAKAEGQIEPEVEPSDETESPAETDADDQPVQADAETVPDEQSVQADAETDAEAADMGEAADEEASVKASEKNHAPEMDEEGKDGPSTADFVIVSIFAAILGLLLCLPTLLGSSSGTGYEYDTSGGVATSINGVEIGENDVTNYISSFRMAQGLADDDAWGQWLVDNDYTPEQLRASVMDFFTTRELFVQAAKELDVEVSESDVDAQLASIAEQVGGEEALSEALEMQGTSVEEYRETISLGLLEEALVEKVGSDSEAVTDEAVLEIMKMYFPDQVPEDAESLEGLDASMVDSVRTLLKQQAFSDWFNQYREKAAITVNDMPEGLPYAIDLSGYEKTTEDLAEPVEYLELEEESQSGESAKQ